MTRIESIGFSSEIKTTLKHLADEAKHNKDLPLFHRIMGLLLISQKWDIESVAEAYGVTPRSVILLDYEVFKGSFYLIDCK